MLNRSSLFQALSIVMKAVVPRRTFHVAFCAALLAGCNGEERSAPLSGSSPNPPAGASRSPASGSPGEAADPPRFVDVTAGSGVDFTYRNGEEAGHVSILESLGGGLAAVDFDLDGQEDLFVAGGGEYGPDQEILGLPCSLFRNRGGWRFAEVTGRAHAAGGAYYNHGIARGDYDQDGLPDLLITGYGGVELLHNLGDGTFESVTQAGLDDRLWSSGAAWGDVNGDGHLDLYLTHYVDWSFENNPFCDIGDGRREICPPKLFQGLPDTLYFSNGDGTFRDVSTEVGLNPDGKGLGVLMADLDLDGDLEIYVTNDTVPNFLYRNDGAGKLTDRSLMSGTSLSDKASPDGSMGVDLFDYNLDGLPDLWVVNYESETAALYQNGGDLFFRHVSQPMGINKVGSLFVGWGTCCFDMERDGDEDMFVSNGHVIRYPVNAQVRQNPLLFRNNPGSRGGFENVAPAIEGYMSEPHMGRGAAAVDIDNDGDVDLAVSHTNEPISLLSNETDPEGGWLAVDLIGTASPRDAVGAVVRIVTPDGEFVRHWKGGGSYASTNSRRLHFGLGAAEKIDSVTVVWPSGIEQTVIAPGRDSLIRIVEDSSLMPAHPL